MSPRTYLFWVNIIARPILCWSTTRRPGPDATQYRHLFTQTVDHTHHSFDKRSVYGLHFLHLKADFPNYSPWNDWSKMTDEGWYGSAAIQHFLIGSWFLPGSFNPAVAMPVWPLILSMWFGLTGVGMVSARTLTLLLYGVSLLFLFRILTERRSWQSTLSIVPALAVLLMTVNPSVMPSTD